MGSVSFEAAIASPLGAFLVFSFSMIPKDPTTDTRVQTVCLMALAVVAVTFSIYWLRPVLVPLVVALIVVSGVSPILTTLERRLGVNRLIAAGLTFVSGVGLMIAFGVSVWMSMVDLNANSEMYRVRVQEIVDWAELRVEAIGSRMEEEAALFLPTRELSVDVTKSPEVDKANEPTMRDASEFVDAFIRDGISIISQAFISLVSTCAIVMIYVFFLLIGTPTVGDDWPMVREIDQQIRSYLGLKTIISIFTGLAFGLALRMFGVPMAFTFGVLAFLLNFVPNIGPLVASLLPIPLILLNPEGSIGWMASAIVVTCGIQGISGNLIEPKIMGNSSDLHPVTVLVALMFWGMMWGVIGMFLATPITAAMKILLQRIDSTRPLADLMAGRFSANGDAEDRSLVV
ncbi:AI-2 transport protein TqsA [Rosistilla oblonga]|uniref:AI-2 transport protein TqsA n=2 Tax=Rosistilla oblonga TaxID=2527990 RepID=A0A518ITL3_9BACT|nr:AI-2 transport protein TqsA [Rosistilla oblonga]